MKPVNAANAWGLNKPRTAHSKPEGVKVALIGHGVDSSHPDLAGKIEDGVSFTGSPVNEDPMGQGTHIAGIVAGGSKPPLANPGVDTVTSPLQPETLEGNGFATPGVCAAAALLLSAKPDMTNEELKAALIQEADRFGFQVARGN